MWVAETGVGTLSISVCVCVCFVFVEDKINSTVKLMTTWVGQLFMNVKEELWVGGISLIW